MEEGEIKEIIELNKEIIPKLIELGILTDNKDNLRDYNIGNSNYGGQLIQPWTIWLAYPGLTSWDHDIIKRILRTKDEPGINYIDSRKLDYQKIIHICNERLRQLKYK